MVFIGDIIAREEEYIGGRGTYVDDEGNIRATVIGKVNKNDEKKIISVRGKMNLARKGDYAFGFVSDVKDKVIMIKIQEIKDPKNNSKAMLKNSGIIFIQNLSNGFLDNPKQAIKIGDLIRAQVIDEDATAYILSLKEPNCGVFLAKCSSCRSDLKFKAKDKNSKDLALMVCPKCNNLETRRITRDYVYGSDLNEN